MIGNPMAGKVAYSKILTIAIAVLALLALPSFAPAGLSMTPSSGDYHFHKQGGKMDFLVTNYADYAETVSFSLFGDASAYTSATPTYETIGPGETKKFTVALTPSNFEYNRKYLLQVNVASESSRVSGQLGIFFEDSPGETQYTLSGSPSDSLKSETNLVNRLFTFFAAALLVGVGIYLIKSRGPWKD